MEQCDTSLRDHLDNSLKNLVKNLEESLKSSIASMVKDSEELILQRIDGLEGRVNKVEQEVQSLKTELRTHSLSNHAK